MAYIAISVFELTSSIYSTGVSPTLIGYSLQGASKYGFYEYFKKTYADIAGPENAVKYKNLIFLAGSASAEFIADVALVPVSLQKKIEKERYLTGSVEELTI